MKLHNITEIDEFLKAVAECNGNVYLTSPYGDKYNLKSKLNQYIAIAGLVGSNAHELELWCDEKEDEARMINFLMTHPEVC